MFQMKLITPVINTGNNTMTNAISNCVRFGFIMIVLDSM